MEIIHVVLGKANPQRMNGVNKVVYELATRQALSGRRVEVWGLTADPVVNYPERCFDTRLFRSYTNKFSLDPGFNEAAAAHAGKAVFHLHGGFNPAFYSVSSVLHKLGIPFVFTPHGAYNTVALRKSRARKALYFHLFEKRVLERAAAIHSLGKSEIAGLRKLYPNSKSKLAPYGYEWEADQLAEPQPGKLIVGFCGRIDIYTKGLDLLVKAFSQLVATRSEAELWIIGDSKEKAKLEKLIAEAGIKEQTRLWGSRFGEEKIELLRQVHIFAHPSRNEGLPTAVLEAAALGIPAVVTEATNVGDSIRKHDAGRVIDHPDAHELFGALEGMARIIDKEGWDLVRHRSLQMIKEEYNWNKVLRTFDAIYTPSHG